jgi:hypothetical protein
MSDNTPNDAGTPKITIEAASLFGGKQVEQVSVDSNHINPISESDRIWLDALAIPPRFVDQLLQATTWMSGSAFAASILTAGPIPDGWLIPLGLIVAGPVAAGFYGFINFPRLQPFILYRLCLLVFGAIVGVTL